MLVYVVYWLSYSLHSGGTRKTNESARIMLTTLVGVVFGYFLGASFPLVSLNKVCFASSECQCSPLCLHPFDIFQNLQINLPSSLISSLDVAIDVQRSPSIRITEIPGINKTSKVLLLNSAIIL